MGIGTEWFTFFLVSMYQTILEIAQGILIIGGALCMILLFVILVIGIFTSVKVLEIAQKISRTVGYVRGSVVEPVVHTFTKIHRRL